MQMKQMKHIRVFIIMLLFLDIFVFHILYEGKTFSNTNLSYECIHGSTNQRKVQEVRI